MSDALNVDEVIREYLACAVWSECDADGGNLTDRFDADDFSQDSRERAAKDVAAFLSAASEAINALQMAIELGASEDLADADETTGSLTTEYGLSSDLGYNLWLSRNGHGAGFFDRDHIPEAIRDALQEAAEALGTCDVIEGDDSQLHLC